MNLANERRREIWCFDSREYGGSEMNLVRVLSSAVDPQRCIVIHDAMMPSEVHVFLRQVGVRTEAKRFGNRLLDLWRLIGPILSLVVRFRYDLFVIWCHHCDSNRWLQLLLAATRRRFVIVEQCIPTDRNAFAHSRLSPIIKRFVAPRAVACVVNAPSQRDNYLRLFRLPHSVNVVAIKNSRDIKAIATVVDERRKKRRSGKAFVLLCVARLDVAQKGQDTLLRAFAIVRKIVPHCTVQLVGDGPDREELMRMAAQLEFPSEEVVFEGRVADPLPYYSSADLFVLPSIFEGLPGALIEAMASRLPCVASDIPGNRDLVVHRETGLLVPPRDPKALADAIVEFWRDPAFAERCSNAARELVMRSFSEDTEMSTWRHLLR